MKKIVAIILFLSLCLSMWGCSNTNSNASKPTNDKTDTTTTSIDPNGFSSLEQVVEAYVGIQTGSATREQLYKLYPVQYWKEYRDFDLFYSEFWDTLSDTKESLVNQYGTNYKVTFQIVNSEVSTDYSKENINQSTNQEFKDAYGVDMKERCDYRITIAITISGSIKEKTTHTSIYFKKIGNKWYG